jgi:hypothetical protein
MIGILLLLPQQPMIKYFSGNEDLPHNPLIAAAPDVHDRQTKSHRKKDSPVSPIMMYLNRYAYDILYFLSDTQFNSLL